MFINTTFQSVQGAGEFRVRSWVFLSPFTLSVFASLPEHTPGSEGGNNVDTWKPEEENYALCWPFSKVHVLQPLDSHAALLKTNVWFASCDIYPRIHAIMPL
jgi:hypothetical protein